APYRPELAVVCGAVYAGLNPKVVTSRITRRCYGVGVMYYFDEKIDPIELKTHQTDGIWCNNRFKPFVRKAQKVEVNECVTYPLYLTQEQVKENYSVSIYAIDGDPQRYTTAAGMSKLASISFPNPFKSSDPIGHKVDIEEKMYFGLNEIRAEVVVQGKKYTTTLRFDSGSSY
ncbi:hypothetical protein EDD21DRAFT_25859, partial [Dissophora ornata]